MQIPPARPASWGMQSLFGLFGSEASAASRLGYPVAARRTDRPVHEPVTAAAKSSSPIRSSFGLPSYQALQYGCQGDYSSNGTNVPPVVAYRTLNEGHANHVPHAMPHVDIGGETATPTGSVELPIPVYNRHTFPKTLPTSSLCAQTDKAYKMPSFSLTGENALFEGIAEAHQNHPLRTEEEHFTHFQSEDPPAQPMLSLEKESNKVPVPTSVAAEVAEIAEECRLLSRTETADAFAKVDELEPFAPEDLHCVFLDTLSAHGLHATIAALKGETALIGDSDLSCDGDQIEVLVPPGMPETVPQQYRRAVEASAQQEVFLEECNEQVLEQRARLLKVFEHVQAMRAEHSSPTEEQMRMTARFKEIEAKKDNHRRASQALERMHGSLQEELRRQEQEKESLRQSIRDKSENTDLVKAKIPPLAANIEEMRIQAENCEHVRAQRIRHLLLNWDVPQGPRFIAAETFAHVDTNHDGRLEWQSDEICRFVRLLFHYHRIEVPSWPESVWLELYRCMNASAGANEQHFKSGSADMTESVRFARGCFEAALRALVGG